MMALSMRDEHFKVQMFRFVDVLASLHRGSRHRPASRRIFRRHAQRLRPAHPHTGVRSRASSRGISGQFLRWNVSGMARQFIAGKNPQDVMKTLRKTPPARESDSPSICWAKQS